MTGMGTEWKQYHFTLKTGALEASVQNHLELTVGHKGTLWLSPVSYTHLDVYKRQVIVTDQ